MAVNATSDLRQPSTETLDIGKPTKKVRLANALEFKKTLETKKRKDAPQPKSEDRKSDTRAERLRLKEIRPNVRSEDIRKTPVPETEGPETLNKLQENKLLNKEEDITAVNEARTFQNAAHHEAEEMYSAGHEEGTPLQRALFQREEIIESDDLLAEMLAEFAQKIQKTSEVAFAETPVAFDLSEVETTLENQISAPEGGIIDDAILIAWHPSEAQKSPLEVVHPDTHENTSHVTSKKLEQGRMLETSLLVAAFANDDAEPTKFAPEESLEETPLEFFEHTGKTTDGVGVRLTSVESKTVSSLLEKGESSHAQEVQGELPSTSSDGSLSQEQTGQGSMAGERSMALLSEFVDAEHPGIIDATQKSAFSQALRAESPLKSYMNPASLTQQITVTLQQMQDQGTNRIKLQLNPAELGMLNIRLEMREGKLKANFSAENQDTLDLLKRDPASLESSLKEVGLKLDLEDLSFSLFDERTGDSSFVKEVREFNSETASKIQEVPGKIQGTAEFLLVPRGLLDVYA